MLREAVAAGRMLQPERLALLCSVALTAAWCQDSILDVARRLFASDARVKRAQAIRSGRRLKIAILGAGMGGSALALWLRDLFGDQVDIAVFTNGSIGGRCQALELDGQRYEAGASIISEVNVLFKALMGRFSLKKRELSKCNMPLAVFNGTRFLFSTASTATTSGWKFAAKMLSFWKLGWRFGFLSLLRLNSLSQRSCAPNFARLYRALRDGAAYAHPRELLSTLGHGCLHLTQRQADKWLVREMNIPGPLVQELAEPGMRANYGGQGCGALHAFVGLVSIIGGISSKCFAVLGGNSQVAEKAVEAAEPRILRASARVLRKDRHVDTSALYEPAFEVGYYALPDTAEGARQSPWPVAAKEAREPETEALRVEAFHIVVVAHPLEHSNLCFEGCCGTSQARAPAPFRRCATHFLRGTLNLRYFAEATFRQATPKELRAASGAYEDDPQASMPLFAPAQILTTADASTPFYSIGLQLPVDTASPAQADEIVASAEKGESQVYKVFAPEPLPEEELDKWFNRCRSSPLHVVDWHAYPQYSIPQNFRPFVLDQDGVFYTNAIEQVASAMEMSLIGARNVTNLIADWVAQRRGPRGF